MKVGKVHEGWKDTCRWERYMKVGKVHADGNGT